MNSYKRMNSLIIAIIMVGLCSAVLFSQQSYKKVQSLKIGLRSDISTIYPWKMTDVETYYILQNVYETLIKLKKDADEIEPGLALKWTPSKDYKTWTFSLRHNVKFHDGSIFNSDSVIATFSLVPSFPGKVEKIDDYTVRFNLDKPNAAFALSLTVANYGMVGEATIKCFNNKKCDKIIAVGTGPFRLESWQPRKQVVLKKNQNYRGDKAYLDEAIFVAFENSAALMNALKNQTIHLSPAILPGDIAEIRKIPYLQFQSQPALTLGYLGMDTKKPPFNEKKIRIAISYSINKKEYINKYFFGGWAGTEAKSCLPAPMFGYYKELPERDYDPAKAKALLAEAGYPNGFKAVLLTSNVSRPYLPDPVGMAEGIKLYLDAIGIKVSILAPKTREEFGKIYMEDKYDLMLFGWVADTIDPNDFLTSLLSSRAINTTNRAKWSNASFDALLDKARSQSISERKDTYREAQLLFYDEMPFIPLVNALQLAAWNVKVKGFKWHASGRLILQNIRLSE